MKKRLQQIKESLARNNPREMAMDHFEAARQLINFIRHPDVDKSKLPVRFATRTHVNNYVQENPSRAASMLDTLHKHYPHVAKQMNQKPVTRKDFDAAASNSYNKNKYRSNYSNISFKEDFDAEELIEFLLDEGHTLDEIEDFMLNDFEEVLIEHLIDLSEESEQLEEAKSSKKKTVKPAYGSESWKRTQQWGGGREHNEDPDTADEKRKARKLAGLDEGLVSNIKNRISGRREKVLTKIRSHSDKADVRARKYLNTAINEPDLDKKETLLNKATNQNKIASKSNKIYWGTSKQQDGLKSTKNYFKGIKEEVELDEGIISNIKNRLSGRRAEVQRKLAIKGFGHSFNASIRKGLHDVSNYPDLRDEHKRIGLKHLAVGQSATRKMQDLSKTKNYFKGVKEEFDTSDLTEELLMEIKMKLKPGQKMTPKQFAKMKAEVLAAQKAKAEKKAQPKPQPKEETIENDDNNRNARILKGQFPWGKVNPELAKTAISKLKQIEKPADRLKAIDKIWSNRKHFASLTSTGKVDLSDEPKETKSKITLPKVRGVNEDKTFFNSLIEEMSEETQKHFRFPIKKKGDSEDSHFGLRFKQDVYKDIKKLNSWNNKAKAEHGLNHTGGWAGSGGSHLHYENKKRVDKEKVALHAKNHFGFDVQATKEFE